MSFPDRGRGDEPGGGAILVAVAVVVGLLVLAVVDDGGPGSSAPSSPATTVAPVPQTNADGTPVATTAPPADTTATTKAKKSTTTTVNTRGARPNDQVVVQVLNGSGLQGAAGTRTNDLKAKGYQTVPAGNAPAQRDGTGVQCKEGYAKEAQVLANTLQELGVNATVEALTQPLPAGFDATANCYVILGR
jgi:LytR cell envelope-related transcriptional attenuator